MHFFRKYSGPVLAVFGVVLMVTWVAGPWLESIFSTRGRTADGEDANRVVVTYAGGTLREADLRHMRYEHNTAVTFLAGIVSQTLQNGGTPQAPGVDISPQGEILSPGIPVDDSDASLVQTMLLADKARQLGVTVDDASVKDFLDRLSAYTMKEGDWFDLAQKVAPPQSGFSVGQLFDRLKIELLAQHMRMMELSGLTAVSGGQIMPITPPPSELWSYFLRLHRRASIEAVAFDVQKYVKQVKDPTRADETELRALFEKGRDRDPNPAFPEPGFYRPQQAAFEYFRVDFKPFLEDAKKQITEEQIKKEYEEAIARGEFKELELPPESDDAPMDQPKEDAADAPKSDDAAPAEKPADKPAEDAPAADEAPAKSDSPSNEPPAESPADAPKSDEPQPNEGNVRSFRASGQEFRFVSTQNEEAVEKSASEADKSDAPPPAENDPPATETKPAAPASNDQPAADADAKAEKPSTEAPSSDKPAEEAAPPKFKPLEEVREQIIDRLAQPIAEDARQKAMQELVEAVRAYGQKYRRYQSALENKSKTAKDPGKFNVQAVAKDITGVTAESTPLISRYQASEYDIGQNASLFNWQTGSSFGFGDVAFGPDEMLYDPKYVNSREQDVLYIFWRTKAEAAATPTFEEAREDVVAAWKRQKAYEIARQEAEELAKKAEKAESLKDVTDPNVVITPPAFSWLSMGSVPFGMNRPELSIVPGIELAGQEFMKDVFSISEGGAGTAVNQPHSRVYAVKVLKFEPKQEELRDRFAESGLFETMAVVGAQWREAVADQRQHLDEEFDVSWQRPPQPGSRMR